MYRLDAKHLFLTYPKCNVPKEEAFEILGKLFDCNKLAVGHELHEDGSDHLHVYIELTRRKHFNRPDFADIVYKQETFHGNYQSCRSYKAVFKYVSKGNDVKANFTFDDLKSHTRKEIAKMILEKNMSSHEAVTEYPQLLFGYKRFKADLEQYKRDIEDTRVEIPLYLPNPWGKIFYTRRNSKKRHLWIFSRLPNKGKTTMFAVPLERSYKVALQVGDFTYWNVRGDESAIIIDEYNTAKLKYSDVNSMCDGTFLYRIFQGGVIQFKTNPLIIILSNQSIAEIYPIMNNLLYARFIEYEL